MFKIKLNALYAIAEYAINAKKKLYPFGGLNRKDLFDKSAEEYIPQLLTLQKLRDQYVSRAPDSAKITIELLQELKGGFCGELASFTKQIILNKYPDACVEIAELDNHEFVVIGRKKASNPNDFTTWGEAIICDPWSDEIYLASEFITKQKTNKPIPMYTFGGPTGLELSSEYYLSGTPKIVASINQANTVTPSPTPAQVSIQALVSQRTLEDPRTHYDKAVGLFNDGQIEDACKLFLVALRKYSTSAKPHNKECALCCSGLASCYRDLNDYAKAISYCEEGKVFLKAANFTDESPEIIKLMKKLQGINDKQEESKLSGSRSSIVPS